MAQHAPRTVRRHSAFAAICIVMAARLSFGQVAWGQTATESGYAGAALVAYDVVSVKPLAPGRVARSTAIENVPDGMQVQSATVLDLL